MLRTLCTLLVLAGVAIGTETVRAADSAVVAAPAPAVTIRADHPRIFLDKARIDWLKKKTAGKSVAEVTSMAGRSPQGLALVYVITGDAQSGREAITKALATNATDIRGVEAVAITYDWCYDLLSDEDKAAFQAKLVPAMEKAVNDRRAWRSFHNGLYTQGWTAASAALALYGDAPAAKAAIDLMMPEWADVNKTFDNVFFDGAWGEGYNYNHHISPSALKFYLALKTAAGVDMTQARYLKQNGYYMIYGAKPNGLIYPGQDNDFPTLGDRDHAGLLEMVVAYGNPYYQDFINTCPVENFAFYDSLKWQDLLWYDSSVQSKPVASLPLSRIFRDEGRVFARSGWGWDATGKRKEDSWISFKCGPYYGDHAHFDNNAFEIYYKGELAIDSGRYDDDWGIEPGSAQYAKSQFFNYYKRSIAHNTILVYDPSEKMEDGIRNDGGQMELLHIDGKRNVPEDYDQGNYPSGDGRAPGSCDWATNPGRWNTGKVLAYQANDLFTYVCGDATKSYSPAKMGEFVRQFIYLRPDVVIVFDRVVSKDPSFKKTWLLHSIEEPKIAAGDASFEFSYQEGRLVCVPVLPQKRTVKKVGGAGDEFLVNGYHYKCGPQSEGNPSELHPGELPGAWRIEESPAEPAARDYFLNVIQVTDKGRTDVPVVAAGDKDAAAVTVTLSDGRIVTTSFGKDGSPSGSLKIEKGGKTLYDAPLVDRVVLEDGRPE